jgi:hypothetical protein
MAVPLFPLGRVVATPGALNLLVIAGQDPGELLDRHRSGDWGDVPPEDAVENRRSVRRGWRILSSYPVGEAGAKVWIIIMWNVQPPGSVFESAVRCPTGAAWGLQG